MDGRELFQTIEPLLANQYNTPNLGNYEDPIDELIFICLCTKTPPKNVKRAFYNLKMIGTWDEILSSPAGKIAKSIRVGGLADKKEGEIREILKYIISNAGKLDLAFLHEFDDDAVFKWLTDIPGVGHKIAHCVMLFALKRDVFPVDTHVARILRRLALVDPEMKPETINSTVVDMLPPGLSHSLHVNLIVHGRRICRAVRPKCGTCCINNYCAYAGHHHIDRL